MKFSTEEIASNFLEISSEQRLAIITNLDEKPINISSMAKVLDATVPEVHRNFTRLAKAGLISKQVDRTFELTQYGKIICSQIPIMVFMSDNKKYFQNHNFGDLPEKFIQRIGALSNSIIINGYVKVSEKWKEIYKNAEKFIYNILVEVSYSSDTMNILAEKLEKGIKVNSIFSDVVIVTKEREKSISKMDMKKFTQDETLKRKMKKGVMISLVLNEKEAGICFPTDEADLSKMFYSSDKDFHEWCIDYFKDNWENAGSFQESKLRE